jgi:hypothetical protein
MTTPMPVSVAMTSRVVSFHLRDAMGLYGAGASATGVKEWLLMSHG